MPRWELHTFYNPKKDLKALHLGTYPLHLYETARGSSHERYSFTVWEFQATHPVLGQQKIQIRRNFFFIWEFTI